MTVIVYEIIDKQKLLNPNPHHSLLLYKEYQTLQKVKARIKGYQTK